MGRWWAFAGAWLGLAAAQAPNDLPPELLLLARIKVTMAENLERLPNYTCLQTIERSRRRANSGKFELLDTLRLEVALVGGKELYSWPGAGKFEDKELRDIIGGGTSGTGSFGLHARSVFLTRSPTFNYAGKTVRDGRRAVRYDYRVPVMLSGYQIRMDEQKGIVGYHGSFWADAVTLDLIRLEVYAEDIPPHLLISEARDAIEYRRTHIGDGQFLLPVSAELSMIDFAGNESRNRTTFSGCRQYTGESFLTFGDPPPGPAPDHPPQPIVPFRVPAGLLIEVKLETAIESGRSAVGDPVAATVTRDVRKDGAALIPKGAVLHGRITRLERRKAAADYFALGLQFSTVEFPQHQGELRATLVDLAVVSGGTGARSQPGWRFFRPTPQDEGVIFSSGSRLYVPKGLHMTWRTSAIME